MATLRDIKRRIGSVKSTAKITKAMKMVAAAKLKRSQDQMMAARPYADMISNVLHGLAAKCDVTDHPLLAVRENPKKVRVIMVTSDRGLCGSFNTNLIKKASKWIIANGGGYDEVVFDFLGKKGFEFFKSNGAGMKMGNYYEGVLTKPDFATAEVIGQTLIDDYISGNFDAAYLVYNEFKSVIQQNLMTGRDLRDFIYEPGKEALLNEVVPRHFKIQLYRAIVESVASEHAARMTAMENATNNANDMISGLTLTYNKLRQAAITKELLEIVGGAEALKG
jgi:F-type H+-transporting ATPase subunit gamma